MSRSKDPSLADIYRETGEIHTKVDRLLDDREADQRHAASLEKRVRKLERWRSALFGALSLASAIAGYLKVKS